MPATATISPPAGLLADGDIAGSPAATPSGPSPRGYGPLVVVAGTVVLLLLGAIGFVFVSGGETADDVSTVEEITEDAAEDEPVETPPPGSAADEQPDETEPVVTEAAVVPVETQAPSVTPAAPEPMPTVAATLPPPPTAPPAAPTTIPPPPTVGSSPLQQYQLGTSSTGAPIIAYRGGTIGGRTMVVVGGVFPEARRGESIVNELIQLSVPAGIELLIVPNPNPSGGGRANPNGVNLNRNFPTADWRFIEPGRDHSGGSAGSEVETQNLVSLFNQTEPELVVVLSNANNGAVDFNPRVERQDLPNTYANLVGVGVSRVPCDSCTGNLTTFVNDVYGDAFFVGVPSSFDSRTYAQALIQLAIEL